MLYLAILAIFGALVVRLVRGDSVWRLDVMRIELWPLALAAITLQLMLFAPSMAGTLSVWSVPLHAASLLLMLWVLVANRRVPGITLVTLGLGLNAAVLMANGGFMPVDRDALEIAQGPRRRAARSRSAPEDVPGGVGDFAVGTRRHPARATGRQGVQRGRSGGRVGGLCLSEYAEETA